jgi:5'-phosphate synthase pdxT subunit
MIERLDARPSLVRTVENLREVDRLIIPGGESTAIQLLIDTFNLREPLLEFGRRRPVWGTCAGLIVLSDSVDDPAIHPLKLIDISAARNAYGRQIDSFIDEGTACIHAVTQPFQMVFIRAPKIVSLGSHVTPIAHCRGEVVGAMQRNVLVTAFHPELTDNPAFHEFFLELDAVSL